jgi:ribonuclease HI
LRLVVHVDGGARGNPGPAAIGVVLTTADGEEVAEVAETIGTATNNVAEYRALLRGIELAREHGASELEIYGDSELVVRQVRGEYKVKDAGLKPLHAEVHAALAEVDSWSFAHVRRENNADADLLVNQALDSAG